MVNENKKKPNWTESELNALTDGISANISLLKGKFSLSVTNEAKNKCWAGITERVNSVNPSAIKRQVADIKKKWQDIQSLAKKKEAARLKAVRRTGGGPPPEDTLKSWKKNVIGTFTKTMVEGIEGGFDTSDGISCGSGAVGGQPNATETAFFLCVAQQDNMMQSVDEMPDDRTPTDDFNEDVCSQAETSSSSAPATSASKGKKRAAMSKQDAASEAEERYFLLEESKLQKIEMCRAKKLKIMEQMLEMQRRSTVALEAIRASQQTEHQFGIDLHCLSPVIKFSESYFGFFLVF
ncbi:unnamed protein product [Mytilus coruscus]|uniref:Myb/SANT-like DNA-binding domain-containing protein n=1 Tax=Mytilus coruscus TaxID=42192 RepID=A0A6J8B0T3_MYTCO|nr:unnamed protein product [Mytilus coruscus]